MSKITKLYYWFFIILMYTCKIKIAYPEDQRADSLNYRGKYTSDIKNFEIVVPQRVNKDGSFISHLVSHHHSKRSAKELEFIFYKIPIAGKDYLIELTPNRKLISPGAVVEIHKEDVGKLKPVNKSSQTKKFGNIFTNLNIKKLRNTECHFSGHVKGENISKAALSTCYGLAGFIQIRKGFYTIEPVADHNPLIEDAYPHILYKSDGLENFSVCHTMGDFTASLADQVIRKRRESNFGLSLPMYIEALIVMDKTLINHHQDSDCENYVLTVFNMAFNLFHDASLGLMMTLTIVRIIRLEVESDEMNLKVNADAKKTLEFFQTWQYEINPGDDSHPNHHDIAVLITRVNVCYAPSSCGLLGLTTIGKACDPKLSAALCEDNGLRLGYVIAHEIGHLLGAGHDLANSTCNGTDTDGLKTVMNPHVPINAQTWSKCSQTYFKTFFDNGFGNCFFDEPEEHQFNVQDLLPGVMYNADFQCKHLITLNARECDMGSTCNSLNCYVPGYACIISNMPPADGTHCGENMWCHDTKCLVVGERPGAIDGNWGEWSAWSDCSRTCGSGVANSVRHCDKPLPSHGGKNCVGERKRYKICAATKITTDPQNISDLIRFISEEVNVSFVGKPCETGRPSFRDIQCGEFDDWLYPEDGKTHTWKAHYFHDDNPCTLYCISEEKQVAALRPRVVDGTMCYRGIRDICVGGTCKSLPCDLHFESNAVEDACGICHGDGTGCEFSEGMETLTKLSKGLTKLVNIPVGTRNIKVEETSPTLARIIVRDKDTKDIYIRGKTLGMFSVPGSQAWLGMLKKNQEALNIPGPVTKPLSIWVQRLENVTVKWSMALPVEQQRKPEFAWDFLRWGPCSAKCGPGTQKSTPSCMEEKAGLVEDIFCADLEMPSTKVRPCEVTKCEPRWMVGDWKGCEPGSLKKQRKRVVFCIKTIGEGEGESQIISDSECPQPKPHDKESCENRQKREDTEYNIENEASYSENKPLFRSDSVELSFRKKYDDYLKHFAALSVPQRKSETIPLHLVSSPHFKHYFRVLETPEDYEAESASDDGMNINFTNSSVVDPQAQSKVSPNFYKNTFSGHQIDVSHFQSKVSLREDANLWESEIGRRISKSINKLLNRQFPVKSNSKKLNLNQLPNDLKTQTPVLKFFNPPLSSKDFSQKNLKIKNLRKRYIIQPYKQSFYIGKNFADYSSYKNSAKKNKMAQQKKITEALYKPTLPRFIRSPKHRLFFLNNNLKKHFNFTSPNLTKVIENMSRGNELIKKKYLKLIEKGKRSSLCPLEKAKLRSYLWDVRYPKNIRPKTEKQFLHFSFLNKSEEKISSKAVLEKSQNKENDNRRKMFIKEFDGSGVRRLNIKSDKKKLTYYESSTIKTENFSKWPFRKTLYSNPFDPLNTSGFNFNLKKPTFKGKHMTLDELVNEKRTKRFRKTNALEMQKRSTIPARCDSHHEKLKAMACGCRISQVCYYVNKRKRSSHRWKKPKSKELNLKPNKDLPNIGCGTETRNYLNNLFRDNHPKMSTKQDQKQVNEKPVINIGELVIDKDSVNDQRIDLIYQDEEGEETQKLGLLPQPPYNKKRITLRGQEVFDLYQKLQPRSRHEAFYRAANGSEGNQGKVEINIKIPDSSTTKKIEIDGVSVNSTQTPQLPENTTTVTTPAPNITTPSTKVTSNENVTSTTNAAITTTSSPITNHVTVTDNTSNAFTNITTTKPENVSSITNVSVQSTTTTIGPEASSTGKNPTEIKDSMEESECPDYDIDENFVETTQSTTQSESKKKKKKKKKNKKKSKSDADKLKSLYLETKQMEDNPCLYK